MATINIDILNLPSDWLEQDRERRLAKRRKAIRAKHRRRWLRRMRRQIKRSVNNG